MFHPLWYLSTQISYIDFQNFYLKHWISHLLLILIFPKLFIKHYHYFHYFCFICWFFCFLDVLSPNHKALAIFTWGPRALTNSVLSDHDTSNNRIICHQSNNINWVSKCGMEYPLTKFFKIYNEGSESALPTIP